jgi:hypothetical protein
VSVSKTTANNATRERTKARANSFRRDGDAFDAGLVPLAESGLVCIPLLIHRQRPTRSFATEG